LPTALPVSATEPPSPTATLDFLAIQNPVPALAWSPDGSTLSVSALSGVYLFDARSGELLQALAEGRFLAPLVVEPKNGLLLAGSQVWDMTNGAPRYQLAHETITNAAFSPDGSTLVIGDMQTVYLVDTATGRTLKSLGGDFGNAIFGLAFSPDGKYLYAVSSEHTVKRIDLASGAQELLFTLPEDGCCTLFSPDLATLYVNRPAGGMGSKQLWDVRRGELIQDLGNCDSDVLLAAFNPKERDFVIGPCGMDAQLWSAATLQMLHAFPSHSADDYFPEWRSAAFSPDGASLALGNDIGQVLIWDSATYQLLRTLSIPLAATPASP
jgi:WD40 repeat protein